MKKTAPKVFTPNVTKGNSDGERYVLYRHGTGLFSVTPKGKKFRASYEKDTCGLGCYCGAVLTNVSATAKKFLAQAERIDNMSKPLLERDGR